VSAPQGNGDCFVVAFNLVVNANDDRQRLCHGTVVREYDRLAHQHAWVEETDTYDVPVQDGSDTIPIRHTQAFDKANGHNVELPADLYRKLGKASDVVEYTREQAMALAIETGHYGPWHDHDPWDDLDVNYVSTIPRWMLTAARLDYEDPTMTADELVGAWVENMMCNATDAANETGDLGVRASCRICGMDIEWAGDAWRGRGGEATCDESGAARRVDDDGEPVDWPSTPHEPVVS